MKSIYLIFGLLVSSGLCWGASTDEFQFISMLSAPVASFDTVETKSCQQVSPVETAGRFNVGTVASTGGNIIIKGKPIQVKTFYMGDDTKIKSSANIHWLVDTLTVGKGGSVTVQNLIASKVSLNQGNTSLTVDEEIQIKDDDTYVKDMIISTLKTYQCEGDMGSVCFNFIPSETSEEATWGTAIQPQTFSNGAGTETSTDYVTKYYPISTEF